MKSFPAVRITRHLGIRVFVVAAVVALALLALSLRSPATPALTKTYTNPAYGFALKMPAGFSAHPPNASPGHDKTGALTGEAIVLQNDAGAAVQIVVTQSGEASPNNAFTAADLKREVPYVDPSEAQSVQLASGVMGMTFTQGGPPPAPTSTDVLMFTYRGNLYELTAATKDRALFEAIMATWTLI